MLGVGLSIPAVAVRTVLPSFAEAMRRYYQNLGYAAVADFNSDLYFLPELGGELVVNGDFSNGLASFAATLNTGTVTVANGILTISNPDTRLTQITQTVPIKSGSLYELAVEVLSITQGSFGVALAGNALGQSFNTPGTKRFHFTASGNTINVDLKRIAGPATGTFDNLSVREVLPNRLRIATREEWFSQYTASGTSSRTYVDQNGVWRNDLAANAPRFDWSNGKRQHLLENQLTNKVTCAKSNPTSTAGLTKGGDAAATLAVVNDAAALEAAGLSSVCSNGMVYKLDNSAGTTTAHAVLTGSQGNTNAHTRCAYVRGGAGAIGRNSGIDNTAFAASGGYMLRSDLNRIDGTSGSETTIKVSEGQTLYFILPGLYEQSFAPAHPIPGSELAAVTRPIETHRLPAIAEAILQQPAATVVVRGQIMKPTGSNPRIVGGTGGIGFISVGGTNAVDTYNGTTNLRNTISVDWWRTAFGAAASWDATGRAVTANGDAPDADANSIGDRSVVYLGRDGSGSYADGRYDFFGITFGRQADSWLQSEARAAA